MNSKKILAAGIIFSITCAAFAGCGASADEVKAGQDQVVIYSNADDEAVTAMTNALNNNGFEGKYIFETFGTSELGGDRKSVV